MVPAFLCCMPLFRGSGDQRGLSAVSSILLPACSSTRTAQMHQVTCRVPGKLNFFMSITRLSIPDLPGDLSRSMAPVPLLGGRSMGDVMGELVALGRPSSSVRSSCP